MTAIGTAPENEGANVPILRARRRCHPVPLAQAEHNLCDGGASQCSRRGTGFHAYRAAYLLNAYQVRSQSRCSASNGHYLSTTRARTVQGPDAVLTWWRLGGTTLAQLYRKGCRRVCAATCNSLRPLQVACRSMARTFLKLKYACLTHGADAGHRSRKRGSGRTCVTRRTGRWHSRRPEIFGRRLLGAHTAGHALQVLQQEHVTCLPAAHSTCCHQIPGRSCLASRLRYLALCLHRCRLCHRQNWRRPCWCRCFRHFHF